MRRTVEPIVTEESRANSTDLEPLVLLEDEPVENWQQDELGLLDFSRIIASAALGTRGPFTIGVYGAWGEGKTSVLKQAQTLLDRESGRRDNIVTVWFNAWQYEHEDHPIVPLVASIVDQIDKTLNERKSLAQTDREAVGKAFRKMRDALRSVAYGFSYAGFSAKEMIDRYEELQRSGHPVLDRSLYYNAYEVLAEAIPMELRIGNIEKMPRIVVFIDDLDRCLPEKAVRLLESIKLVLTQPGFIFALAVYKPVIRAFINAEFKRQLEGVEIANPGVDYLDKIIQLALPLPSHESRFARYVEDLLKRPMFLSEPNHQLCAIVTELRDVLAKGVRHNPRSLVRLINNLIVDRTLYLAVNDKVNDQTDIIGLFVVSRILQAQIKDDDVFDHLVSDQNVCTRIADAKNIADLRQVVEQGDVVKVHDLSRRNEQLTIALFNALDRAPHLFDLLITTPGKKWLEDPDARRAVTHFLAAARTETAEEAAGKSQTQDEIINNAIRESLKLKADAPITDEHRRRIDSIHLSFSSVTDAGLAHLAGLTSLTQLYLADTQVTDAGLSHLAGLTSLTKLYLARTQVTDAGVAKLREALSRCRIEWDRA